MSMEPRRERPFEGRLTVLTVLTAGVALVIAGALLILHEALTLRSDMSANLETVTQVIADNSTAALAFADRRAGEETLRALRALPNVNAAALYDEHGKLFAAYRRDESALAPGLLPATLADVNPASPGQLASLRKVTLDGRLLGTALVRAELLALRVRLLGYGAALVVVLLASLGIASLLMSRLRRRLAVAEENLHALNATLEQRVFDRTTELEVANRELESFSYSVSHDLRAPLRAINGFSQIILQNEVGKISEDGKRMFDSIVRNSNKMGQLIEDILEYSRSGRAPPERTRVDMASLAQAVVKDAAADYPETSVDIGTLPVVAADRAMVRQLLENLIGNAFKYSARSAQPHLEIGAQSDGGETVFYVRDNGVGFDMQYAGRLFGMFQRMHADDRFPGTGVGLAIVKRLVDRHGGRVWAESAAGQGATFFFTLGAA